MRGDALVVTAARASRPQRGKPGSPIRPVAATPPTNAALAMLTATLWAPAVRLTLLDRRQRSLEPAFFTFAPGPGAGPARRTQAAPAKDLSSSNLSHGADDAGQDPVQP